MEAAAAADFEIAGFEVKPGDVEVKAAKPGLEPTTGDEAKQPAPTHEPLTQRHGRINREIAEPKPAVAVRAGPQPLPGDGGVHLGHRELFVYNALDRIKNAAREANFNGSPTDFITDLGDAIAAELRSAYAVGRDSSR